MNKQLLEGILNRQSAQYGFTDETISQETIDSIILAATRAPNASNRQSYSIISIDDTDKIQHNFGFKAPHALLFCVDYSRVVETAKYLNEPYEVNGIVSLLHGSVDVCLAAQNAALAAEALDVGALFTNSLHRVPIQNIFAEFNLPKKYCFPLIVLLLGKPIHKRDFTKGRLTSTGVVHHNTYQALDDNSLKDLVDYINNTQNHLSPTPFDETQTFLHWYFNNWPNKANTNKQKEMLDCLKQCGFTIE